MIVLNLLQLGVWLMENMQLIKKCGDAYYGQYVTAEHEAFFKISTNTLSGEFSKLHKKGADKDYAPALTFPFCITNALKSVTFTKEDRDAVIAVYRILRDSAPPPPTAKITKQTRDHTREEKLALAKADILGRGMEHLCLDDVERFPCLSMLYRHGLQWHVPESANKKGKSNGFLAYAYFLYTGWRVYGDTIGRMLELQDYHHLRESLFRFLGGICQPSLNDFLGEAHERPPHCLFVNWDHKLLASFVDIHGIPLADSKQARDAAADAAPPILFAAPTVQVQDVTKMTAHTAAVKKIVDNLLKNPLAEYDSGKGTCNSQMAHVIREVAGVRHAFLSILSF